MFPPSQANTAVKVIEGHYTCANATPSNSTHTHTFGFLPCLTLTTCVCLSCNRRSCHTKSVITKPQNVLVLRDIMANGYVAGGGTKFFGSKAATVGEDGKKTYTAEGIKTAIDDRLNMADGNAEYEDMLAFVIPYGHCDRRDQVISISQRLLPWEVNTGGPIHDYFPGGKVGYDTYAAALGLNHIHHGEDLQAVENAEFISQSSINNSLCFLGPHRVYSPFSPTMFELVPGQGHFGPDALPGVSAAPVPALSLSSSFSLVFLLLADAQTFPCCFFPMPRTPAGAAARPSR